MSGPVKIERLAVLYMNQGTDIEQTVKVTRIVWNADDGSDTEYLVTARCKSHPDNYQQQWTYKGDDNAGVRAMSKALSYMGWGELPNADNS